MPPFIQVSKIDQPANKWLDKLVNPWYNEGGWGMDILGTALPPQPAPYLVVADGIPQSSSRLSETIALAGDIRGGDLIYLWVATASSGSTNPDANAVVGFTQIIGPLFNVGPTGRSGGGTLFRRVASGEPGARSPDVGRAVTVSWPTIPNLSSAMYAVVRGTEDPVTTSNTVYDGNPAVFSLAATVGTAGYQLVFASSGVGGDFGSVITFTNVDPLYLAGSSNAGIGMAGAYKGPGALPSITMSRSANNNNVGWVWASVLVEA